MPATLFIRREALGGATTDGPIEITPPGTNLGSLAVLFVAYVSGGGPAYTAISFGKDAVKIPVEAGDTFCSDGLGKDGVYLYRVGLGAGAFRFYAALLTPDLNVLLGSQSLTAARVVDP